MISRILAFFKRAPKEDRYTEGFRAGAWFTRQHATKPAYWARHRSVDYDEFDRGWDDGVRFVLNNKDAARD